MNRLYRDPATGHISVVSDVEPEPVSEPDPGVEVAVEEADEAWPA